LRSPFGDSSRTTISRGRPVCPDDGGGADGGGTDISFLSMDVRPTPVHARVASAGVLGGLATLPLDVVTLLRELRGLSGHLDRITRNTASLPQMLAELRAVREDTRVLPTLDRDMRDVAAATQPLAQMNDATSVLPGMDERMATIESAMPTLVEVQQHLSQLPETIETLGEGLTELSSLLDRLLTSLDQLDENVSGLSNSIGPIGRLAERLPRSGR
jgi:prefoldin subunit 5